MRRVATRRIVCPLHDRLTDSADVSEIYPEDEGRPPSSVKWEVCRIVRDPDTLAP